MGQSQEEAAYDVVIVGAGPGGATAAFLLASAGLRVALLEKQTIPRRKLCGGLITYKTRRLLDRTHGEGTADSLLTGVGGYEAKSYGVWLKKKVLMKSPIATPLWFVTRAEYDESLVRKAQEAGAELFENCKVSEVSIGETPYAKSEDGRIFRGEYLLGSDGAHSLIRREIMKARGTPPEAWTENLATGIEFYAPPGEHIKFVDYPVLIFGYLNMGYAWFFPHTKYMLVGMGGLNRSNTKKNFRQMFNEFTEDMGYPEDNGYKVYGHPVPFGNFILPPGQGKVLMTGDAAGLVDPITGEGIFYSMRSGEIAAKCILRSRSNGGSASDMYNELVDEHISKELKRALELRDFLFKTLNSKFTLPGRWFLNKYNAKLIRLVHGQKAYQSGGDPVAIHEEIHFKN